MARDLTPAEAELIRRLDAALDAGNPALREPGQRLRDRIVAHLVEHRVPSGNETAGETSTEIPADLAVDALVCAAFGATRQEKSHYDRADRGLTPEVRMQSNKWWLPLIGLAFAAVLAVSFALAGSEPPAASDNSAASIVRFYVDNEKNLQISFFVSAFAALLFVYFWSYIRSRLESAPGENGFLSRILWAGVIIFVAGIAIDVTLQVAMVEAAGKVPPETIQTLQALWDNDFVPMAIGIELIATSVALSTLLHGGLPKWLGWLMVVIAIVGFTPWGFFALIGTGIWIVIASVALAIDERKAATTA